MNKKTKRHFIFMTKVYKITTVTLLVCIILLGLLFIDANGQSKCEQVKVVKKEILNPNIVFLGDSITDYYDLDKYFPNVKKINSGIGGNKTWDIKENMYDRVYKYNPSKVVLLIGINNFFVNKSVEDVVNDIKEITTNIHKELPNTEILIQSIYPINDEEKLKQMNSISDDVSLKNMIIDANDLIKEYCKENNYTYIDMYKELSNDDCEFNREYTDDGLHPNENGYKKMTEVLKKYL